MYILKKYIAQINTIFKQFQIVIFVAVCSYSDVGVSTGISNQIYTLKEDNYDEIVRRIPDQSYDSIGNNALFRKTPMSSLFCSFPLFA